MKSEVCDMKRKKWYAQQCSTRTRPKGSIGRFVGAQKGHCYFFMYLSLLEALLAKGPAGIFHVHSSMLCDGEGSVGIMEGDLSGYHPIDIGYRHAF